MRNLIQVLAIGQLVLFFAGAVSAAVTEVPGAVVHQRSLGVEWVDLRVDDGQGISHVCLPLFVSQNPRWSSCEATFVAVNQAAGKRMYRADGQWRLYADETYIGPRPLVAATSAEAAALAQLGNQLAQANQEQIAELRALIIDVDGDLTMLSDELDALTDYVSELSSTVTGIESWRTDTVQPTLDEIKRGEITLDLSKTKVGEQTLVEFVSGQGASSDQAVVQPQPWSWQDWRTWLLLTALAVLALCWLLFGRKRPNIDPAQFASKDDLNGLSHRVAAVERKGEQTASDAPDCAGDTAPALTVVDGGQSDKPKLEFISIPELKRTLNHPVTVTMMAGDTHYAVKITRRKIGDRDGWVWNVPRDEEGTPYDERQLLKFKSVTALKNALNTAYDAGRLEHCRMQKAS